jgi:hypothetical protein
MSSRNFWGTRDLLWKRSTVLSRHGSVWKDYLKTLGSSCLTPVDGFLQIVQREGDLVCERFALFAQNDVLMICKREFAASAQALPQKHRRDMFNSSGASHTSFDAANSVSNTSFY